MQLTLQGRLEYGVIICARTPAAGVRDLLPPGLELATHGRWAFWNIAFGRISGVRPAGVPRGFGTSYQQVAYRLVVHARNAQGRARRGVYFVRSFADCYAAQWLGNRLTDFNIRHADLEQHGEGNAVRLVSVSAAPDAQLDIRVRPAEGWRPAGSCFRSADEAAQWLQCESLGLSTRGRQLRLVTVERDRVMWRPTPVAVDAASFGLFTSLGLEETEPECAITAGPVDYRWRVGARELLADRAGPDGPALGMPA